MDKSEFVKKCGEVLNLAKPHLISCEYCLGKDIELTEVERLSGYRYTDEDEYVFIMCENGYHYNLLVTGNSLIAIAAEIFNSMVNK